MDFQFLKFSGLAKIAMHMILKGSDKKVIAIMKTSTLLIESLFRNFIKIKIVGNINKKCKLLELAISSKLIIGKKIILQQQITFNLLLEINLNKLFHVTAHIKAIEIQTNMKFTNGRISTGNNVSSLAIILEIKIIYPVAGLRKSKGKGRSFAS